MFSNSTLVAFSSLFLTSLQDLVSFSHQARIERDFHSLSGGLLLLKISKLILHLKKQNSVGRRIQKRD